MEKNFIKSHKTMLSVAVVLVAMIFGGVFFAFKPRGESGGDQSAAFAAKAADSFVSHSLLDSSSATPKADIHLYNRVYNDVAGRFSFKYPEGYKISHFQNGDGEVTLVQNATADHGFQIYTVSFDDADTTITKERISNTDPTIKISGEQVVPIGKYGHGLAFISGVGEDQRRELWFVYNGVLYEITAFFKDDEFLQTVLSTWTFNK